MELNYATPEVKVLNCSKGLRRMTFLIAGLNQGKAETLAVAIRRNLIGCIPGLAPAALKIAHEDRQYAPIKGLCNDTNDLTLIIKGLKVKAIDTKTNNMPTQFVMEIDKTYTNEPIKFGDFKVTSDYSHVQAEVLNPDDVLTYVGMENVPVSMKVLIQAGVGYSQYDVQNKLDGAPAEFHDSFPIDSIFSPVVNVSYEVKNQTPSKQKDSLLMTVETNGSILPIEAFYQAAKIMEADAQMLAGLFSIDINPIEAAMLTKYSDTEDARPNKLSPASEIENLALPTDVYDLMKDNGINKVGPLLEFIKGAKIEEISDMRANKDLLAKKEEIKSYLIKAGFTLEEAK